MDDAFIAMELDRFIARAIEEGPATMRLICTLLLLRRN